MKKEIYTEKAPTPTGKYSQAIQAGDFVFISGQLPINESNELISSSSYDIYYQCFQNIKNICEAHNASMDDIVKLNVYYTDISMSPMLDEIFPQFFKYPYPARIRMKVQELSKNAKVEIDAVLYLNKK